MKDIFLTPKNDYLDHIDYMLSPAGMHNVEGLNILNRYEAHKGCKIVIINGHNTSNLLSCLDAMSIKDYEIFKSINVLDNLPEEYKNSLVIKNLPIPKEYENYTWLYNIRVLNHMLKYNDITRIINHMIVWDHCIRSNRLVVVAESDVVFFKNPTQSHNVKNSIVSLSGKIHQHNTNYRCVSNAAAYAIDPFMASNLFSDVLKNGIIEPLEHMFRMDKYMITYNHLATRLRQEE
jgi:hypothetical protein